MGRPFTDITLYNPTPYPKEDPRHSEEIALSGYVSDLYVRKMNGYKPEGATCISIQPAYYGIWTKPWKFGSVISIATEFCHDKYEALDKMGRYNYILEEIHSVMIELCAEYNWDKSVFENAYKSVIQENFRFVIDYPAKQSRDKKKKASLRIEKTETVANLFVHIETEQAAIDVKLLEKRNFYWYDAVYQFAKNGKWFDNDKFGFSWSKGTAEVYYSMENKQISIFQSGQPVQALDFHQLMLL